MRGTLAQSLAVFVAIAACDDVQEHIFTGHLYESQNACLDPSTAIDVVTGEATGNKCAPACLVSGANVYVSTQCPPYPPTYALDLDASDDADPCVAALQDWDAQTLCGVDAGGKGGDGSAAGEAGDAGDAGDDGSAIDAPADAAGE